MIPETFCMSHTMFLVYKTEDYQKYHKEYFSDFGKLKCNFSVDFNYFCSVLQGFDFKGQFFWE